MKKLIMKCEEIFEDHNCVLCRPKEEVKLLRIVEFGK